MEVEKRRCTNWWQAGGRSSRIA